MEATWRCISERFIQEATDEGKFDNVDGRVRALDLEEDMSSPPHLHAANRVLKTAGVVPNWMQMAHGIYAVRKVTGR